MSSNNKICFILSALGDAHQRSRVLSFKERGFDVTVWGVKRKGYKIDANTEQFLEIGDLTNSSLSKRLRVYLNTVAKYIGLRKSTFSYIYIFGLDNLLLFFLADFFSFKSVKVVYEVPDIQPFQYSTSLSSRILQFLERKVVQKIDLMIVTSPEFITGYYENFLKVNIEHSHLLENKVHLFKTKNMGGVVERLNMHVSDTELAGRIVIGYFGLLRCARTLNFLLKLVEVSDRFVVVTRGFFLTHTSKYEQLIERSNTDIYYLGKYVSPVDLPLMYDEIDISWIAYPYSLEQMGNWKWARTNRYYEAGFFNKPMIALKGTSDAKNVLQYNTGITVDLSSFEETKAAFDLVTNEQLDMWSNNLKNLPMDQFQVGSEYNELFDKISSL